jgi:hypothetical protein
MKKHSFRVILGGVALAGLITAGSVAAATALTPVVSGGPAGSGPCATLAAAVKAGPTVANVRAFGDCEIARRMTTLAMLSSKISGSKTLTSPDAAALSAEVASTKSGLTALKATIDAETNLTALRAEVKQIAANFRVYVLVVPQVRLTIGADTVQASKAIFDKVNANLTKRIAAARAAGKNTTAAQADLDAMNTAVAQALSLTAPLPGKLLPLTPAQYNAGTAGPVISSARSALVQARGLLQAARKDAAACRDALK